MKTKLLFIALFASAFTFAQSYTSTLTPLGASGISVQMGTNSAGVALTLSGPSTAWFGIGFGGTGMGSVSDMFIVSSSANRDYTASGYSAPSADASQSWTLVSDNTVGSIRTVAYTRPLVSAGDFTFTNTGASIQIIWALGTSLSINQHAQRGATTISFTLSNDTFALSNASIYPNPSRGNFTIESKTNITKVNIYSQIGTFVKEIELKNQNQNNINVEGLQTGVYMVELVGEKDKTWKKVIIE